MPARSVATRAPQACSAKPQSSAISSTCRISPFANASNIDTGMMFSRKSTTPCFSAWPTYAATFDVSSVAGSTCMPAPGASTFTTTSPTTSAIVVTISK